MNRTVAIAMRDGPEAGLNLIENILRQGDLNHYPLAHANHADLCRRLGRNQQARSAPQRSLSRCLTPTTGITATLVKIRAGRRLITDGPFAETHEQLGGYFLVEPKMPMRQLLLRAAFPLL